MKAITVHRPWDFAILELGKDIENRRWAPSFPAGSALAIHAGKKWDGIGAKWIRNRLGLWLPPESEHPTGIVGIVQYDGTVKRSESKWFTGPVGWQLGKAQTIEPIPCRGKRNLWDVPEDIEAKILEALNPRQCIASEELIGLCGEICGEIGGSVGMALWLEAEELCKHGDATDVWEHYEMLCKGPSQKPHTLYTFGYQGYTPQQLAKWVSEHGACVLDIRHKAATGTAWHTEALKREFFRYHRVRSLGNKNGGGPIELNQAQKGISFVAEMLRWQPVILLCACKNVEGCHRRLVGDMVREAVGCSVKHITSKKNIKKVKRATKAKESPPQSFQRPMAKTVVLAGKSKVSSGLLQGAFRF